MSTFRQNLRSGLYQMLQAWQTQGSNSALIRQVYDHRPPAFDPPLIFIGAMSEAIQHDHQLRMRDFSVEVTMVRASYDNAEQLRLSDVTLDSVLDYLSADWHGVTANTLQEPTTSTDVAIEIGGVPYFATVLTVRGSIHEGRPS